MTEIDPRTAKLEERARIRRRARAWGWTAAIAYIAAPLAACGAGDTDNPVRWMIVATGCGFIGVIAFRARLQAVLELLRHDDANPWNRPWGQ